MDIFKLVFLILGAAFTVIGGVIAIIFFAVDGMGVFVLIPLLFVVIGIGFIIGYIKMTIAENEPKKKGQKYSGKIYGYVENKAVVVNDDFTVNTKVRYFDVNGVEREAIIPTGFAKGSNAYPIGMTIDIYEYKGKFGFDKNSVRDEILPNEAELMDDKPIEPEFRKMTAVECANCGSSYEAIRGYTARCPYCGSVVNAE